MNSFIISHLLKLSKGCKLLTGIMVPFDQCAHIGHFKKICCKPGQKRPKPRPKLTSHAVYLSVFQIGNWSSKLSIWKTEVLDVNDNLTNVIAKLRSCSICFEIDGASAPKMCDSEVLLWVINFLGIPMSKNQYKKKNS